MGKFEEQQPLPSTVVGSETPDQNPENRCRIKRFVGFRCVSVLLLGAAVLLSAVFWLPPFLQDGDQPDLGLDSQFGGHSIVASFKIEKPVDFLKANILQLEDDIFDEIGGVATTKVVVIFLETLAGSNITKVVFVVDPDDAEYSVISSTAQSLIKSSFVSLVISQSSLSLTKALFGEPFSFEVLKFPGGITVIPPQSAFPLQKMQIPFNFTLNFSIYQIQENFNELTSQLKSGLHLASNENLYVKLTNQMGSTVDPPTIVQSSVLLAVGNTSSQPRLKQLAKTITGSHSRNLGLNNTVFGRVKQVHLSSILQHSLHGGDGTATSWSPSPAPVPQPHSHHAHHPHHHHPHHHHPHHVGVHLAPSSAPAPEKSFAPSAPPKRSGCQNGNKGIGRSHFGPAVAPVAAPPEYSAASPNVHVVPPPPVYHQIPASSPLPNVAFSKAQPPSKGVSDEKPTDVTPSPSPLSSSSSIESPCPTLQWVFPLFLLLILSL